MADKIRFKTAASSDDESDSDEDYTENEKILLKKAASARNESEDREEDVLGVYSDSDGNAESDIENNDDYLPDERAWGKGKKNFYSTDYVDADYSGFEAKDLDAAQFEEEEARKIQRRLLEQFDDDDFSLEIFKNDKTQKATDTKKDEESIATDIATLPDSEKLDLLLKESPELLGLIEDYKEKINEVIKYLGPILDMVSQGSIQEDNLIDFIRLKYNVVMKYLMHINFYFLLKSARVNVKYHPVVKQLIKFRQLYNQMNSAQSESLQQKIQRLLHPDLEPIPSKNVNIQTQAGTTADLAQTKIIEKSRSKVETTTEPSVKQKRNMRFKDIPEVHPIPPGESAASESDEPMDIPAADIGSDPSEEGTRRAITYQMAKNKGLTPHRKKEQRNPRVKHRNKYRQAKIRRKGAVRDVRKELSRYAGEISGIKATVTKSIKIK